MEIAGRYTLEREVGRGGMGAVWLGTDLVLGRQVALKRLGLATGPGNPDLERAEREARLAARLNHPHVVAVFDLVQEGEQHWLVMEYVDGLTLAELIRRDGALAPDEAAPLLRQAADALAAAHTSGIVHRDVKPSNILVTPEGQVKLSDFGIARAEADASLTQTGLVTGSPAYLAPEIASGATATAAADVWSLGATTFHALSGHPPYDVGDNLMGALYRIVHEEPPRLANAGWLTALLENTMTREPHDRWPMAQVRDFLDGGPLHAAEIGSPTQALTQPVTPPVPPLGAAPPPVPPSETQVLALTPAASPASPPTARGRRRGGNGLIIGVLLALGVIVLFLLFAWLFGAFDGSASSAPDSSEPSRPSSSETARDSPSPSPSDSAAPDPDAMESFVSSYLTTVTSDPKAAWPMLTPAFQSASGGFGRYKKFWDQYDGAEVNSIDANPDDLTVSYSVTYTRAKDGGTVSDNVRLQLEQDGKGFLIDGEA